MLVKKNQNLIMLIASIVNIVYMIFMVIFLNDVKSCKTLTQNQKTFRETAYVVSIISIILGSLSTSYYLYSMFK